MAGQGTEAKNRGQGRCEKKVGSGPGRDRGGAQG